MWYLLKTNKHLLVNASSRGISEYIRTLAFFGQGSQFIERFEQLPDAEVYIRTNLKEEKPTKITITEPENDSRSYY